MYGVVVWDDTWYLPIHQVFDWWFPVQWFVHGVLDLFLFVHCVLLSALSNCSPFLLCYLRCRFLTCSAS